MDREEFASFYAAAFHRLVGQLHAMTGDLAEAQDAVQEAFTRAWARRGKIDRQQAPEAWIRVTAWRIASSRWRRARNGGRLMAMAAAPGPSPGRHPTVSPSPRRCGKYHPNSAARWSCITCAT